MDRVQSAAVMAANIVLPGSGAVVNSAFELGKVIVQVAQVLSGLEDKASAFKTQQMNIMEDVEDFRWALDMLKRVKNQNKLTEGLQRVIIQFGEEVKEYECVVDKYSKKNILKQLVFHQDVDNASANAKKTKEKLVERLTTECSIDGSGAYGHGDQTDERNKRYMKLVDSQEAVKAMSEPENQKEILAIIARMGHRNDVMMHSTLDTKDRVVSAMKEKLWASSSRSVRADISNLPDWYMTEDEVDIDTATIAGFGGDAKVYQGVLKDGTPVAVKIFNENVKKSDAAKRKFFSTMKLWERLSRYDNICRLYGACYFTATPFIVMEYCDQGPLDTFLRQDEISRYRISLDILVQAGQAVVKMHSIGIVHGDLKCDNVLISGNNRQAKLCDFDRSFDWIAMKDRRLVNSTAAAAGVEITDAVRYLAPECVKGLLPNMKSDVYSFGMTLYHALAGESPYADITSDEELRTCKLNGEFPSRDEKLTNDDAWELITQCCDLTPEQRPTMERIVSTLKLLVDQLPAESKAQRDGQSSKQNRGRAIEKLVNETVGVYGLKNNLFARANRPLKVLPTSTASQAPLKYGDRVPKKELEFDHLRDMLSSKLYRIIGAVVLGVVVIAIIVGIVVSSKQSSSANTTIGETDSASSSPGTGNSTGLSTSGSSSSSSSGDSASVAMFVSTVTNTSMMAMFSDFVGIAVASNGDMYLSDQHHIYKMTESRVVAIVDTSSSLFLPGALTVSNSDDLFVCDNEDASVWTVTSNNIENEFSFSGYATSWPVQHIAVDSVGNVYATNVYNVVKREQGNYYTTFASGNVTLKHTMGIAIDASDNIYVTDAHRVLKFTSDGVGTVLAGSGISGFVDAVGVAARFYYPMSLTIGSDENLYVADTNNHCIRKVSLTTRNVTTFAGICGTSGSINGNATSAMFNRPTNIAAATSNAIYVTDGGLGQQRVRKISSTAPVSTSTESPPVVKVSTVFTTHFNLLGMAVASNGSVYLVVDSNIFRMTDDGNTTQLELDSSLSALFSLAVSKNGDIFVFDSSIGRVLKVSGHTVNTFSSFTSSEMRSIAVGSNDNVYVTTRDELTQIASDGSISATFAVDIAGSFGLGGVAVDASNNIYVTDESRILKFTSMSAMSVLAGSTTTGFADGVGSTARFNFLGGLTIGTDGNLYVADNQNNCIRKVNIITSEVSTFAGSCFKITTGSSSSDGIASSASFNYPMTIAAAPNSVFYVADWIDEAASEARVRKIYME